MWPFPACLWVAILAVLILAGWLVARRDRHVRIVRFGDTTVLGLSQGHYSFIAPPLLEAAAVACVAAVITAEPRIQLPEETTPVLEIVIDRQLLGERPTPTAESAVEVSDTVGVVVDQAPYSRFSVCLSGTPPDCVIPPTRDTQGLFILVNELGVRPPTPGADGIAKTSLRQEQRARNRQAVFISSQSPEDSTAFGSAVSGSAREMVFVRPAAAEAPILFRVRERDGSVRWTPNKLEFRQHLESKSIPEEDFLAWLQRFNAVQSLALLGFLCLAAESLWSHFRHYP